MVTLSNVGDRKNVIKLNIEGLSTDEKPLKTYNGYRIINGSTFTCIDTLDVFFMTKNMKFGLGVHDNGS